MKSLMQPALGLAFSLLAGGSAVTQTHWVKVAVPAYSPAYVLQGLHQHWTRPRPRADDFARQAQALPVAVKALCDAAPPASQAAASGALAMAGHDLLLGAAFLGGRWAAAHAPFPAAHRLLANAPCPD